MRVLVSQERTLEEGFFFVGRRSVCVTESPIESMNFMENPALSGSVASNGQQAILINPSIDIKAIIIIVHNISAGPVTVCRTRSDTRRLQSSDRRAGTSRAIIN